MIVGNPVAIELIDFCRLLIDVAIALQHVALQAVEIGLGTCWIGAFDEKKVKKVLKIPENEAWEVVVCMAVGIPDQTPPARPRKSFEELFNDDYFIQ